MADLAIKCALAGKTGDGIELERVTWAVDHGEFIHMMVDDEDKSTSTYLTRDAAAELFNWLGVQLHLYE